jgi:hypothetical protein
MIASSKSENIKEFSTRKSLTWYYVKNEKKLL